MFFAKIATKLFCLHYLLLWVQLSLFGGEPIKDHWSFIPPELPKSPKVLDKDWVSNQIDEFILSKLEDNGLTPAKTASPSQLIRRIYYDLIGLPPEPAVVKKFIEEYSLDLYKKIIDDLLESPRYGERWGRHWLDVARYGDSNGGDENHAYPHAWRYRDYVIDAFNKDIPFNDFIKQQIAGDLLSAHPKDQSRNLTATGFLAIGTKILAEKDSVKKRADIVDEQIDTLSRSLMGISVSCARCHDHKFDPIPTADYYALAGIFNSTIIEDQVVEKDQVINVIAEKKSQIKDIDEKLVVLDKELQNLIDSEFTVRWEAEEFLRGNIKIIEAGNDSEVTYISDPGSQDNFAEYKINVEKSGTYSFEFRYAAKSARPASLIVNDNKDKLYPILDKVTGGWSSQYQKWIQEAYVHLEMGNHIIRIESKPLMSHLDKIRISLVTDLEKSKKLSKELKNLTQKLYSLKSEKENTYKVMSVKDGEIVDVNINVRGDPHSKGDIVKRGFLTKIRPLKKISCNGNSSGRLELANWMTQPDHPLTARVIVNRIWYWHFGKGIVTTIDDFGTTGDSPSHPALLDFLAINFVEKGWSIKDLHRLIMHSNTYRMSVNNFDRLALTKDPDNLLYSRRDIRRLEAESFRDSILMVSGNLNFSPPTAPLSVKSQDPSPADLLKNRQSYETFFFRSVYLPVIRSHGYDLLALLGFPNATTTVGQRSQTTVPTQALMMMNNPFIIDQSKSLALRFDDIRELYMVLFSRYPNDNETRWVQEFLQNNTKINGEKKAWESLCHTLLISNEFIHVW